MASCDHRSAGSTPSTCERSGPNPITKSGSTVYRPTLDVYDLGDRYEIKVDLPGADAERIHAAVEENILSIHAEVDRRQPDGGALALEEYGVGDFARQVRLGEDVDTGRLVATYELGVLTITLPKASQHQPRRVPVTVG